MKRYIAIILLALSATVSAQNTSTDIGRMSDRLGTSISVSIMNRSGDKYVFIYMRGKHGIRKVYSGMTIYEAKRLRELIDEAISKI